MNTIDKQEAIRHRWTFRSIYGLLFILATLAFYLLYPLPKKEDNEHMLESISDYTIIFDHSDDLSKDVGYVKSNISKMDLSVKQIQKENDIKSDLNKIRVSRNTSTTVQPTTYNEIAAKMLRLYFDSRQLLAITGKNNVFVAKNLEECKGFIKEGGLARAPF